MNEASAVRRGSSRAIAVLLALSVLAQAAIANEIRYQGCISNQMKLAEIYVAAESDRPAPDFECSRVPLI